MNPRQVRLGLLGCGNVGAALVALVERQREVIAARTGLWLVVQRVAVQDLTKGRELGSDVSLTDDATSVVKADDVDIVVEMIGGVEPARGFILAALAAGKPVVTANKALLAEAGAELFAAAEAAGVDILFEAAVAGGIPLMRPLRESLVGEPIGRVLGIVNGTSNYILSRMTDHGASYDEALAEAQRLGYAERDPTADVEGHDAAAKIAIIATIAFGAAVVADDVACEGIAGLTGSDIEHARRLGYVIKPIAIAEQLPGDGAGEVAIRVHPAMVAIAHPLAAVRDSFNAVFIEGGAVGDLMFYGRGAGGTPSASAVLGDIIDAADNQRRNTAAGLGHLPAARIRPMELIRSAYFLTLDVFDRPGVLAQVADVFGRHRVSIRLMEQEGLGDEARIVFITHQATERDVRATLTDLADLDVVDRTGRVIRVIDADG